MTAPHLPTSLTPVDLVVVALVAAAVVTTVRRGSGALGALLVGAVTALACWLLAGVVLSAGPGGATGELRHSVAGSALVQTLPPPVVDLGGPR